MTARLRDRPGWLRAVTPVAALAAAGASSALLAVALGERHLVTTELEVPVTDLDPRLQGLRIVQLSDLHGTEFGVDGGDLIDAVAAARPDLIALTGDILDRGTRELGPLLRLAGRLVAIAPCVAVSGNHEGGTPLGAPLLSGLADAGVRVLRDEITHIELRDTALRVAGMDDPRLQGGPPSRAFSPAVDRVLADRALRRTGLPRRGGAASGAGPDSGPLILLAHRPELLDVYAERGIDVVLSGHAHGGQWRLPLIGGLYAPNQGLLPRLTAGVHRRGTTRMVISRGLKVRRLLPRLHNPPEVLVAVLTRG